MKDYWLSNIETATKLLVEIKNAEAEFDLEVLKASLEDDDIDFEGKNELDDYGESLEMLADGGANDFLEDDDMMDVC